MVTSIFNLNLEFLHLECNFSSWDFEKKFYTTMLLPPALISGVLLVNGAQLAVVAIRSKDSSDHAKRLVGSGAFAHPESLIYH